MFFMDPVANKESASTLANFTLRNGIIALLEFWKLTFLMFYDRVKISKKRREETS